MLTALAGAAALASVLAAAGCGRSAAGTGAPVPASAISRLTAIAYRAATFYGDPSPAWIAAVQTTRRGQRAVRSHPALQVNAGCKSLHMGTRLLLDMSRLVTAGAAWITSGRAGSVSSQTSADPELAPARMPPVTHVSGTARMDRLRISTAHGQNVLMRVTPVPADPGGTGQARTKNGKPVRVAGRREQGTATT